MLMSGPHHWALKETGETGVNSDGVRLLNFIKNNNLVMLNQDKELCS